MRCPISPTRQTGRGIRQLKSPLSPRGSFKKAVGRWVGAVLCLPRELKEVCLKTTFLFLFSPVASVFHHLFRTMLTTHLYTPCFLDLSISKISPKTNQTFALAMTLTKLVAPNKVLWGKMRTLVVWFCYSRFSRVGPQ